MIAGPGGPHRQDTTRRRKGLNSPYTFHHKIPGNLFCIHLSLAPVLSFLCTLPLQIELISYDILPSLLRTAQPVPEHWALQGQTNKHTSNESDRNVVASMMRKKSVHNSETCLGASQVPPWPAGLRSNAAGESTAWCQNLLSKNPSGTLLHLCKSMTRMNTTGISWSQ